MATERIPSSLQAQIIRSAISPRFAMSIFLNMLLNYQLQALCWEQSPHALARSSRPNTKIGAISRPDLRQTGHFFGRMANNSCPYSIGWPFETNFFTTSPATSDSISFINFMASTIQSTCPTETSSPAFTNGGDPGDGDS